MRQYRSNGSGEGFGNRSEPLIEGTSSEHDLNAYVQLGDTIEYQSRNMDRISKPLKGKVTSIGPMNADDIIMIDNLSWLSRSKDMIKRLVISSPFGLSEDQVINPNPKWVDLDKVIVIQPYEDVYSDDDDDDDGDDDNDDVNDHNDNDNDDIDNGDPGNDDDSEVDIEFENSPPSDSYGDESHRSSMDDIARHEGNKDRSKKMSRQRVADGTTGNDIQAETRRAVRENKTLDQRRKTEYFLPWAKECQADYAKGKKAVNELYLGALSYGITHKFYKERIYNVKNKGEFWKKVKSLRLKLSYRAKKRFVKLGIHGVVLFMDNPSYGVRGQSRETVRERVIFEETIHFEYTMRTLQLRTCGVCRENKLMFKDKDLDHERASGGSAISSKVRDDDFVCKLCKDNKYDKNDHYLEGNLHPVWFERDSVGNIAIGTDGKPITRYDIPDELSSLTMAEKLLIRRCSPLIPSHHIKNGVYGINGHCVCFPQDIDKMCDELPRQKSSMVIFVRHISNRANGEVSSRHFKVNKDKVIRALEWLKLHHRGYHNISINESNMDWIESDSIYEYCDKYEFRSKSTKRDDAAESAETISSNQCKERDPNDNMETIHPNFKQNRPNQEQTKLMKELQEAAADSGNIKKVLDFPPIDHNNPLK